MVLCRNLRFVLTINLDIIHSILLFIGITMPTTDVYVTEDVDVALGVADVEARLPVDDVEATLPVADVGKSVI